MCKQMIQQIIVVLVVVIIIVVIIIIVIIVVVVILGILCVQKLTQNNKHYVNKHLIKHKNK
jgi:heme/copper-type cytochrome/quinol oxidase subunit 2